MMTGESPPKLLDDLEPVVETVFRFVQPRIEHEYIERAFGEEELVGGVHDLLPAEVPDVDVCRSLGMTGLRRLGD